jgi:hypothetical protein
MSKIIPDELTTPPASPVVNRTSVVARKPLLKPVAVKPQGWDDDDEPQSPGQRASLNMNGGTPVTQRARMKPKQTLFVLFGFIELISLGKLHAFCSSC